MDAASVETEHAPRPPSRSRCPQINCEPLSIDFDCDAPFDGGIRAPAIVCGHGGSNPADDAGCEIAVIRSPGIQVQADCNMEQDLQVGIGFELSPDGETAAIFVDTGNAGGWSWQLPTVPCGDGPLLCEFKISLAELDFGRVPVGAVSRRCRCPSRTTAPEIVSSRDSPTPRRVSGSSHEPAGEPRLRDNHHPG